MELSCERGNLSLDTQLPLFDAHGNDLIVSCAVSNSVKNVQVLHHYVAIQANIKNLRGRRNDTVRTDSGRQQLKGEQKRKGLCLLCTQNKRALQHTRYHHASSTPLGRIQRPEAARKGHRSIKVAFKYPQIRLLPLT